MVARMKLHLEDIGPINEANINIGKITIVGGHNSSGQNQFHNYQDTSLFVLEGKIKIVEQDFLIFVLEKHQS